MIPALKAAKYVFTPPLREKWHQEKLWQGLARDSLQVVSTDHCPFCFKEQKELGIDDFSKIPNGGPGIEHRLSLYIPAACTATIFAQPVRSTGVDGPGEAVRPVSAQGHNRSGLGRGLIVSIQTTNK